MIQACCPSHHEPAHPILSTNSYFNLSVDLLVKCVFQWIKVKSESLVFVFISLTQDLKSFSHYSIHVQNYFSASNYFFCQWNFNLDTRLKTISHRHLQIFLSCIFVSLSRKNEHSTLFETHLTSDSPLIHVFLSRKLLHTCLQQINSPMTHFPHHANLQISLHWFLEGCWSVSSLRETQIISFDSSLKQTAISNYIQAD